MYFASYETLFLIIPHTAFRSKNTHIYVLFGMKPLS